MKSKDSLKEKVKAWLDEQGYPLEMRIASTLQKKGFRVVQSEYYTDPESGDSRELDVVAYLQKEITGILLRISLLIECKRSTDKPWLLFTSDKISLADSARIAQRAANSLGKQFLLEICRQEDIQEISLFKLPQRPAYGVTQALTNGKDVCFSAATSVAKAAFATMSESDRRKEEKKRKLSLYRRNICEIVLPVIVVEGRMFEVFLDNEVDVTINEATSGTLLWRNPIVGLPHTIINIISSEVFEQFTVEAFSSFEKLFELADEQRSDSLKKALERDSRTPVEIP